jgi:hypothetical protein
MHLNSDGARKAFIEMKSHTLASAAVLAFGPLFAAPVLIAVVAIINAVGITPSANPPHALRMAACR